MKFLIGLIGLTLFASSAYAVNCQDLDSDDSVVLCQQNKRILRKLNRMGNNGSRLVACEVTYCSYQGKAENRSQFRKQCTDSTPSNYWYYRTTDVEARNRAHAREVFANSSMVFHTSREPADIAIESVLCN